MNNTPQSFSQRAAEVEKMLRSDRLIRAVNFHNTSFAQADNYSRQLAHYSRYFSPVNENDLALYLKTGEWRKPKPGLIVSVFEGYRNGYDVFAPLLERHGLTGWFFIITGFLNAPLNEQSNYAAHHDIAMETHEYRDGRYALSWDEVRALERRGHVIASHARSHSELDTLDPAAVEREVLGSQQDFEKQLSHKVRAFVSLTGPPYGQNQIADGLIQKAGYEFVFSNFSIQWLPPRAEQS